MLGIAKLLRQAGINKHFGVSAFEAFQTLILLVFKGKTLYQFLHSKCKDEIARELEEEIGTGEYSVIIEIISRYSEYFLGMNSKLDKLCYDLETMANYDEDDVNQILTDKYSHIAYEENLDRYIELAADEARNIKEELIESSEESIKLLLESIQEYERKLRDLSNDIICWFRDNQRLNEQINK